MTSPVPDSYSCASGGVIAGGRYATRPYLVALGHSMIAHSALDTSWAWVGMAVESPHKWLNTFLRKPFDYIKCDIDMPATNNMVNGFYGQSGDSSTQVNAVAQTFIDTVTPICGTRRVVVGLMACENDLTGGGTGAGSWANYQLILDKMSAAGWQSILSTSVPTSYYNTNSERDQVTAFGNLLNAALPDSRIKAVLNWTSPYQDMGNANGYQQPLAGYTTDGIHLNKKGAFSLGLAGSVTMAGMYPAWVPKVSDVVCSQNPALATLGGTLGAGASGVVPAGFTLQASGASVVGSQVGDYYQMQFAYSGAANTSVALHGLIASAFGANYTIGSTVIESLCDVEIIECTNYQWQSRSELDGSHIGECPAIDGYATDNWMDVAAGRRLVLHTEPHVVPAGTIKTTTSFGARIVYGATSASLTVRIRWIGTKQHG